MCVAGAREGQGGASTLNGGRVGACAITIEGGLKDEHCTCQWPISFKVGNKMAEHESKMR